MKFEHVYWLDDKGHIKPPGYLYLLLAFLAKAWVVWVMSLTQASDRAALVRALYPMQADFIQALIVGAGAVLIFLLVLAERRRKPYWARPLFNRGRPILMAVLMAEAVVWGQRFMHSDGLFHWSVALDALALFWCAIYLLKSRHLKGYFKDWRADSLV
ncbi:MAG: DUF2919 domain-containing protein [Shewanella sp.]|nr:DUF2919 domain-containing protein [Shewanella sp.]MCF1456843.1 DUF2919 domain-containing protein [Shewanella sp.]